VVNAAGYWLKKLAGGSCGISILDSGAPVAFHEVRRTAWVP